MYASRLQLPHVTQQQKEKCPKEEQLSSSTECVRTVQSDLSEMEKTVQTESEKLRKLEEEQRIKLEERDEAIKESNSKLSKTCMLIATSTCK